MELEDFNNNSTIGDTNGAQLKFQNLSYTVENKKYKKQIKKQIKDQKKRDYENNNDSDENQNYTVEKEITILKNVSGVIEKGELCALLGPSGSGKSTLLDCLAQRKTTGKLTGKLLINGTEFGEGYKKFCSYVTQEDILLQTATVYETIKFYADLKLPDMTEDEKKQRTEQVIEDIGLTKKRDSKIGGFLPGGIFIKGLSGGEKRRVSIGCGLVTNPSLIFLDEPTSGLDAVTALSVMKVLLNLTKIKGCTIITSIHQPRPEIFQLFNKVMLIIKGRMIYSGNNILEYFEELGYKCPINFNPADFCLDVAVEIGDSNRYNEICSIWENKWENQVLNENTYALVRIEKPKTVPMHLQYYYLLKRSYIDLIRNPGNFIARVTTTVVIGLLYGACFYGLKNTDRDVQKVIGLIFFLINGLSVTPYAAITIFISQRALFNSERAARIYHSFPYYMSLVTVESLVVFIIALLNAGICYLLAGLRMDASSFIYAMVGYFFLHWLSDFEICTLCNITGSSDLTFAYGSGLSVVFMLFSGYFVSVNELPKAFGWLHYINPLFYSFASLMHIQFDNLELKCENDPCIYKNGYEVLKSFGIDDWTADSAFGIVVIWTVFFFITSYIALHYLNKEKR